MSSRYDVISPNTLEAIRRDAELSRLKDRIEKLEAALQKIKDLHHEGGVDGLQVDDMTYKIVCDALEKKDGE